MLNDEKLIPLKDFLIKGDNKIDLKDFKTDYEGKTLNKEEAVLMLEQGRKHLAEIQDKLYAHNRYSILIILQAMDAAGKDGTIKHIMSGLNPSGVKVHSFKQPTAVELDHDFFWRHELALPARGEIAIHNRSHYENVLVTQVHPEYLLNENLPDIESAKQANDEFWLKRYKQIRRFEKNLAENGTIILKFFLHISKEEQKKRFLQRIDDPGRNWKFSMADLNERKYWDKYQQAYARVMQHTSRTHAPWFVIPADNKWFARLAIASVIYRQFEKLDLRYPKVTPTQKAKLLEARTMLMQEPTYNIQAKKKATSKRK